MRSIAVAERLGFCLEGKLRHTGMAENGEMVDNLRCALIPSDPRWP